MFRHLKCRYTPRKYQREALALVHDRVARGERRFHIVAPPGAGKTILGLQLVIDFNRPALVLAPNAGIQSQWVDKLRLFVPPDSGLDPDTHISGDPAVFRPIMALTYQSLTTRSRDERGPDSPAQARWIAQLVADGEVEDEDEALVLVRRLRVANPARYERRMAAHERALLMELTDPADTLAYLHPNARALIDHLVEQGTGTFVLDECHHLTGYWARVAQAIVGRLDDTVIVGLTATPPPEAHEADDEDNTYLQLVGDIDYRVPTPAVIREGHLAPFQDLVYFCRPTAAELAFVADADAQINAVRGELEGPPNRLADWVSGELATRPTPSGKQQDWPTYLKRRRTFCAACRDYFTEVGRPVRPEIRDVIPARALAEGEARMIVLERYVNRHLALSSDPADHAMAVRIRSASRLAGYQITARGLRACESPVNRVLARSRAKAEALVPILSAEQEVLGKDLRAVVITDFERSSATRADETDRLIDDETGGAIQAFRVLT